MKLLIRAIALLVLTALTATAFIPLPKKLRITQGRAIPIARTLHPSVQCGDTVIAYLADAAGNVATAWAIVDSATTDSFFVHIIPQQTEGNNGRP